LAIVFTVKEREERERKKKEGRGGERRPRGEEGNLEEESEVVSHSSAPDTQTTNYIEN